MLEELSDLKEAFPLVHHISSQMKKPGNLLFSFIGNKNIIL